MEASSRSISNQCLMTTAEPERARMCCTVPRLPGSGSHGPVCLVQQPSSHQPYLVPDPGLVVDDEVVEAVDAPLPRHRGGCGADLPELGGGHLQGRLVRLVGGPDRVVAAGAARHLDVAA